MVPAPPFVAPNATVAAKAGDGALTIDDFGKNLTNTGAAGKVTLTLPDAKDVAGLALRVFLTVAQIVALSPVATEAVFLAGSGVVNKDLNIAALVGNSVEIYSDGENYHAYNANGVITKEA
jgi:hypothetical protein